MRLMTLPGVFRPRPDSWMLARQLCARLPAQARVLDLCTGSGLIAVAAARHRAAEATAIDVSRRAVLTARINARPAARPRPGAPRATGVPRGAVVAARTNPRLNGVRVRGLRGDLFAPVAGERFDAIVSNPPYLPAADDTLPDRGPARAWDAGTDGRILLDRICAQAAGHLEPGGFVLVVHSSIIGVEPTVRALEATGLRADVVERRRGALGPLLTSRAELLEARGLLAPGEREEEIVIVRGAAA